MSCVSWVKGISADIDDMHEKKEFNAPGPQFLIFMGTMYLGIRGFMDYGQYYAAVPLVQRIGVGTAEGAQITSTMRLPWSLKCVWAMISDSQPIFHFKKRWYMLGATISGAIAIWQLASLPYATLAGGDQAGTLCLILLLLVNVMGSLDDCLTQGQYTKVIKRKGSSILVFRSTCMTIASTTASLYAGVLNDIPGNGPQLLMWTALPWAVLACGPIAINMMADERQETPCTTDRELISRSKGVFLLATAMGITVLVNIAFGIVPDLKPLKGMRMFITNACMCGVLTLSFYTIDKRIAKINVYLYLCRLCTFSLGYPLQQFYTTDPANCPLVDGKVLNLPNFTFVIFSTFGGLATSAATFLGLFLFENYLVHWNAQRAFWVTTAFQVVAGSFDIMNTTRFNQILLGWTGLGSTFIEVPENMFNWDQGSRSVRADDMASFLFGTALLEPLIDQLDQLPATLMLSKLCPKGIETTMFAILAGFSNIGLSLAGQVGGFATAFFGFNFQAATDANPALCEMGGGQENTGNPQSFHGLARTLVIGNILLPFITIPLTWCFIPNQRLDEEFLDEPEAETELAQANAEPGPTASTASRSFVQGTSIDVDKFRESRSNVGGSGLLM